MLDLNQIITFLKDDIKDFVERNKTKRQEKEKNGDFFNIFSILKVERDEVYTHSAMLCELLNPNGSHGMKDNFLQLFIEEMPLQNIEDKNSLDTQSAKVKKEEPIETIDKKKELGGKIDILIEFEKSKYAIIIENKIDARDQYAQLARYYNSAKKKYKKNFTIFYLTKYGNEPSEIAKGETLKGKTNKDKYWTCISYTKNIKSWLNKCMEKCLDSSPVRGTIKQYINLIDKITDQELNMSDDNKELIKEIYSKNLYDVASEFGNVWQQKDILIAEIIAEKISSKNHNWIPLNGDYEKTTIFKKIDSNMYIFFEPQSCQIGFHSINGLKKKEPKLKEILNNLNFKFLSQTEPMPSSYKKKVIWYYIEFRYKNEDTTTEKTIEEDYYNDINNALKTLEKKYKEKFK